MEILPSKVVSATDSLETDFLSLSYAPIPSKQSSIATGSAQFARMDVSSASARKLGR